MVGPPYSSIPFAIFNCDQKVTKEDLHDGNDPIGVNVSIDGMQIRQVWPWVLMHAIILILRGLIGKDIRGALPYMVRMKEISQALEQIIKGVLVVFSKYEPPVGTSLLLIK